MNTYEINKIMHGDGSSPSPFKLVSMTVKSIDIPWSLFRFNWADVKVEGVEILLMPAPCQTKKGPKPSEKDNSEENKGN